MTIRRIVFVILLLVALSLLVFSTQLHEHLNLSLIPRMLLFSTLVICAMLLVFKLAVVRICVFSVLFLGAAVLMIKPSLRAATPEDDLRKGRVVVQYWEKWVGAEGEQMKIIVDEFNRTVGADKKIYVEYLSMSQIDRKTLIATAAGDPPDVAGLWAEQIAQFGALGALEPLDDMAAAHGINASYYKKVYWDALHYGDGPDRKLYGLVSTPAVIVMHYNKKLMAQSADALRAKGLDPTRPPRSIDELNAYAAALDIIDPDTKVMKQTGYLPMEPGWYVPYTNVWFGGTSYDPATHKLQLDAPEMVRALTWIEGFSKRLGSKAIDSFHSGLGSFDSAQNPFLTGAIVMEQQGPWMANYIRNLAPAMSNPDWANIDFPSLEKHNPAEYKEIMDKYLALPLKQRRDMAIWAVAPFPSETKPADPDWTKDADNGYCFCPFDTLVIPATSRHKKEAFEFIAFVNRQDVMEHLCQMHCKNTPLTHTSATWLSRHPNSYIEIFDRLASSPNAHTVPSCPIWPEVATEINTMSQDVAVHAGEADHAPAKVAAAAQKNMQSGVDHFFEREKLHH